MSMILVVRAGKVHPPVFPLLPMTTAMPMKARWLRWVPRQWLWIRAAVGLSPLFLSPKHPPFLRKQQQQQQQPLLLHQHRQRPHLRRRRRQRQRSRYGSRRDPVPGHLRPHSPVPLMDLCPPLRLLLRGPLRPQARRSSARRVLRQGRRQPRTNRALLRHHGGLLLHVDHDHSLDLLLLALDPGAGRLLEIRRAGRVLFGPHRRRRRRGLFRRD
mmetsp:Transcript_33151/g.67799  ORF Transcript_33151/g.67799 Transcript_33151/m.67799 type:complete len:214 (+) Transcript_33151:604-1245(+)